MAELTPMMRQYLEIKERHPDCILFFRLGDFYEMFADDAKLASHELDLTLTTRDRGKEKSEQVPMCGVPYHSAESYIARLVARGYKVASVSRWRTLRWPRALSSGISPVSSRRERSSKAPCSTRAATIILPASSARAAATA